MKHIFARAALLAALLPLGACGGSAGLDMSVGADAETPDIAEVAERRAPREADEAVSLSALGVRRPARPQAPALTAEQLARMTSQERTEASLREIEASVERDNAIARQAVRSMCVGC